MSGATASMFSPLWHRVEAIRPRVRPELNIERHVIRGDVWYVAKDRFSTRAHRFSAGVYAVLMRMDGRRTLGEIWSEVAERFGENAPSQGQVLQLVGQLYAFGLVQADRAVDTRELAERARDVARRQALQQVQNPLFLRIPLLDPDRFLGATAHLLRPLFSAGGFLLWLAAVGWFLAQAAIRWEALTENVADRVLAADNLVLLAVVYPALKALHELAHAYAVKLRGGEVHEMGVMLLVLLPAPYVDASASAVFASRRARVLVAAAGMMAELLVAAGAMAVWIAAEPGLTRALAFNTMLIASVSTVVFNANPLLRLDGYHILADLIDVPNLGTRAARWYVYLAQRHLFGMAEARSPVTARGEAVWFALYAPASLAYRLTVLAAIAAVVGTKYFVVGVALILWTLTLALVWPVVKALRFVLVSPALRRRRGRALAVTLAGALLLAGALFALPVPYATVARGVVWLPEESRIVAGTAGTVLEIAQPPGSRVAADEVLFRMEDPYLAAQRARAAAQLQELRDRLILSEAETPFETQVIRKQAEFAEDELREADRKLAALTLRSPVAGAFLVPRPEALVGAHARRGQLLGYVMPGTAPLVRAVVAEDDIDLVRGLTREAAVRLEGERWRPVRHLEIARAVPGSTRRLPSAALGENMGGPLALDPRAREPDTALQPFFVVDVALPPDVAPERWGERAWVRFDHGAEPIANRLWRWARQTFLRVFHV
ncbi:MAG TPA: hypothetical protein VE684_19945 [Crenalkalicoccus sp.]|nr:hypothetical protein [Crenalkalicoccus sp.]